MYKVMIIDDDAQVRERLKTIIDWKGLPLELVCEAGDSDSALEMYLLYRPKIIISDISIPVISGLELAEIMRKEDADLQFIIITGYNDFEWAKQSVRLGAIDLLSKPVFPEEINRSLKKVIDYFSNKQQEQSSVDFLNGLVTENLPKMQESFMMNLLRRSPEEKSGVEKHMKQLQIDCPGPYYAVVLVGIKSPSSELDQDVRLFLLRDALTANMLAAGFKILSYMDIHSRLNCIISSTHADPDNNIEEVLTKTDEQLKFTASMQLISGIGPTVDSPTKLCDSRSGALTALNYQCVLGDSSVMHFKNMERLDVVFHTQNEIDSYLLRLFRENDFSSITTTVENHIKVISSFGVEPQKRIREFLFEYVQLITNEALRLGLAVERMENYVPTIIKVMQAEDDRAASDVLNLTEEMLKALNGRKNGESNHLMRLAKAYISEHLGDENLCLESVSEHIGLSRIYFCKLFHQMEGTSFSSYLKQERIEKAKNLLLTTNLKVFEISCAVGFSQAKYFGYVFKQAVGLTPVEFQRQGLSQPNLAT